MSQLDVLIPHYNDNTGLALSLASVKGQSWSGDIRVVICDDGSSPSDYDGARAAAEQSGLDVVLLRNGTNRGRPYTRNVLLEAMESPIVAWLDAGDEWYPRKTALQIDALLKARSETDTSIGCIATCNYHWANSPGQRAQRRQIVDQDQFKALLIGRTLRAYLWTLIGWRETFQAIGPFDTRLARLQDLDYCLRFVAMGGSFIAPASDEPLCVYHKSDIGRNAQEIRRCNAIVHEKHYGRIANYGRRFVRTRAFGAEMLSARFAHSNGDRRTMLRYFARAGVARPRLLLSHLVRKGLRP